MYVMLFVCLFIAGVADAGKSDVSVFTVVGQNGTIYATCTEDPNGKIISCTTPCQEKMRDVMQKMDRILNMPIVKNKNFETLPMQQWNAVMTECVQ